MCHQMRTIGISSQCQSLVALVILLRNCARNPITVRFGINQALTLICLTSWLTAFECAVRPQPLLVWLQWLMEIMLIFVLLTVPLNSWSGTEMAGMFWRLTYSSGRKLAEERKAWSSIWTKTMIYEKFNSKSTKLALV